MKSSIWAVLDAVVQAVQNVTRRRCELRHCWLTDFELLDPDVEATLTKYRSFPGIVHTAVLNSSAPECLIEDDRVTVTQINNDSPTGSVAQAVFAALTACRREAKS